MKVATHVVLLAALAATASAGRCDAPFKTLSSDCRGAGYDAKTLCLVVDQRGGAQPSPCQSGTVARQQTECAASTGEQCDVLSYNAEYEPGVARFQITFSRDSARRLVDANATDTSPPPPTTGSNNGAADNGVSGIPEPAPTSDVEHVIRVDRPVTPAPTLAPPLVQPETLDAETQPPTVSTPKPTSTPATQPPTQPPPTQPPAATRVDVSTPKPTSTTEIVIRVDRPATPAPTAAARPNEDLSVVPPATPKPSSTPEQVIRGDRPATAAPTPTTRPNEDLGVVSPATPTPTSTAEQVIRGDRPVTLAPTVASNGPATSPPAATRVTSPTTPRTQATGESGVVTSAPSVSSPGTISTNGTPQSVQTPTMVSVTEGASSKPTDGSSPTPNAGPVAASSGDSAAAASESNRFVTAIGPLALDASFKELRIVGGASEYGERGTVAQLRLDPQLLAQSPSVESLWISNCDVGEQLAAGGILSGMPTGLTQLFMRNTLLRSEPSDLSALRNLRTLGMGQNYLTAVTSKVSLPKLKSLDLAENALTSIEVFVPELESLYLKKNNLTAIPSAVYSMKKLQELQLAGNPIYAIVTSATQYDFLNKIHVTIDKPATKPLQPVVYVPGPLTEPLPADITNMVLSSRSADLSNAVAIDVGTLVNLEGEYPVWKLPDVIYEVFQAQQEMLAKSQILVGGVKMVPYLVAVAAASAAVTSTPQINSSGAVSSTANSTSDAPPTVSTTTSKESDKSHMTLIISLVAVGVVAVALMGLLFVRRRRRLDNAAKADDETFSTLATPQGGSSAASFQVGVTSKRSENDSIEYFGALVPSSDDARVRDLFSSRRVRASDLEDVRPISSSDAYVVWLVKMRGSRDLASKRLIQSASTAIRMAKFVNEVVIAADLDYPQIVRLVGVSWTNETDLQALYEYMPNGDLQTYLHNDTSPDALSWTPEKLQMAIDIVEALVYTHSFNPPLVHRDLRTRNVLLDEHMRPKLTNFGSARFASEQSTMTTDGVGSARWLAPEILNGSSDYDHASDMFALGVLLCELDTHAVPYEGVMDPNGKPITEIGLMELVSVGELRPTVSSTCPATIGGIVSRCLLQDPASRPTAMQVAYELRSLARERKQASSQLASQDELAPAVSSVVE